MYYHFNEKSGLKAPLIADDVYEVIMKVLFILGRCNLAHVCEVSVILLNFGVTRNFFSSKERIR